VDIFTIALIRNGDESNRFRQRRTWTIRICWKK